LSHRSRKLKKNVVVVFFWLNKIPFQRTQDSSTSFCNKNSLSYQRRYDEEIVENRKVGNPVVFLWESFWPKLTIVFSFFAENSHYANFQRNRRGSGWKTAFFATLDVK
jgi:hypothetical protein